MLTSACRNNNYIINSASRLNVDLKHFLGMKMIQRLQNPVNKNVIWLRIDYKMNLAPKSPS